MEFEIGYHMAESQAFVDGNKRAALDVALTFLAINGFEIEDEEMELYDAMIAIAEKRMSKEQIADLFERLVAKWWLSRALTLRIPLSLTQRQPLRF